MKIGDKVKLSNSDIEYTITKIYHPNSEISERLEEIDSYMKICTTDEIRRILLIHRNNLLLVSPGLKFELLPNEIQGQESERPTKFIDDKTNDTLLCTRKPQSEITNLAYELANDRLKTSTEGYAEFCKAFNLPKTEQGQDIFRRYKQSGSGLSNLVKFFEAQYHKEHYTEIPNFYDHDYDEG